MEKELQLDATEDRNFSYIFDIEKWDDGLVNKAIKEIRMSKGLKQIEVVKELNTSKPYYTKPHYTHVENGKYKMSLKLLRKLTKVLGLKVQIKITPAKKNDFDKLINDAGIQSTIENLPADKRFWITLIAQLTSDCVDEKIITPMQKSQILKYINPI